MPFEFLEKLDQYSPSIRMSFKGEENHKTKCGGFLTIIFFSAIITFFVQRVMILVYYGQDQY